MQNLSYCASLVYYALSPLNLHKDNFIITESDLLWRSLAALGHPATQEVITNYLGAKHYGRDALLRLDK